MASDSIFAGISDFWRIRQGTNLAEREIACLLRKEKSTEEVEAARPSFFAVENNMLYPTHQFVVAWRQRWTLQGRIDANNALFRNGQFGSHYYESGWLQAVDDLRKLGFKHAKNDALFELIISHRNSVADGVLRNWDKRLDD
jgi:hypothetical protein